MDGREIKDFPWSETLPAGQTHWLIDNKRTGYYTHKESPRLRLTRGTQRWTYIGTPCFEKPVKAYPGWDERNYNPTEGDFSKAWFEHGAKPDVTKCAYTLIPQTTPEAMAMFAAEMELETGNSKLDDGKEGDMASNTSKQVSGNKPQASNFPPYRIIQKDAKAHILWDRNSNTTGYIIFNPSWILETGSSRLDEGKEKGTELGNSNRVSSFKFQASLLSVNRPCSVMLKDEAGMLRLSVASTDMDEWPHCASGKIRLSGSIVLTLDGTWEIAGAGEVAAKECAASHCDGKTVLQIPYKTFMPTRLTLRKTL